MYWNPPKRFHTIPDDPSISELKLVIYSICVICVTTAHGVHKYKESLCLLSLLSLSPSTGYQPSVLAPRLRRLGLDDHGRRDQLQSRAQPHAESGDDILQNNYLFRKDLVLRV